MASLMPAVASADVTRLADALRESARRSNVTTVQVLVEASGYILSEMERRAPVRSGTLRRSLGARMEGNSVIIGPDPTVAPYATYVINPTKPHTIKPKTPGGYLRFQVGGKTVYARQVNHPGTKGNPFIQDSFNAWVDSLGEMAAEANIRVIRTEAAK